MKGGIPILLCVTSILIGDCLMAEEPSLGVGPVKKVELSALDSKLSEKGGQVFTSKCSACHKIGERYVGPDLAGITKRRAPEWIMNMILNPAEMTQKDSTAQELFGEYLIQMTNQNLSQEDARALLEYFREKDK